MKVTQNRYPRSNDHGNKVIQNHYPRSNVLEFEALNKRRVNFLWNIFAKIERRVKIYEELINWKSVHPNRKLFLSLIQENQPVVFTKQPVVYTSKFEK